MAALIPFYLQQDSPLADRDVRLWAVELLGDDLAYAKYGISEQAKDRIVYTQESRSVGTWLATVLLFPFGLVVFFAMKRVSSVTVLLDASPSGHTSIEISGAASRRVVDAIRYRVAADLELEEVS